MKILLAIFIPPLAVLLCGKPVQAIVNFILCLFFYIPGLIHALMVVSGHNADKRNDKLVAAINNQSK